jgi:hypothetical protein
MANIESVTLQAGKLTQRIADYESGFLDDKREILYLFSDLLASGLINHLQGHYGRQARQFIQAGYLKEDGTILKGGAQ